MRRTHVAEMARGKLRNGDPPAGILGRAAIILHSKRRRDGVASEAGGPYALAMTITERIAQDLTLAMKARDGARTSTLRMAKAAIKNKEIDKGGELDDSEATRLLQTLVKQREEAAAQYSKGRREDLAAKELGEAAMLREYLPALANEEEIAAAVSGAVDEVGATSPKDMGRVIKGALARLEAMGRAADGKSVSEAVRKRLAG